MKVSELLEAVDPSISSIVPKVLVGRMFRIFNLDAEKSVMTKLKARPTAASSLKDSILITKTSENEWIAAAYNDRSTTSFKDDSSIVVMNSKTPQVQYVTFASLKDMLKEKGATVYWTIPFISPAYRTRSKIKQEIARDNTSKRAYEKLDELRSIFGRKYKETAVKYIDEIFANLRALDGKSTGALFTKSDRQLALEAATRIEELIEKDFNRSSLEKFLISKNRYSGGWDSFSSNEHIFNKLMTEPAANAKFALLFFNEIKAIHNDVMEKVKLAKAGK